MEIAQLIYSASAAQAAGQFGEAIRLCNQVLDLEPKNVKALLIAGVVEAKAGDPERAARLLAQVRSLDSKSFQTPFWLAHSLRRMGRSSEALVAVGHAVALKPNDAQALLLLGMCEMDVRRLADSERHLRQAAEADPTAPHIRFSLSQCLYLRGRRLEASELLQGAVQSTPQTAESLLLLAQFFLSQNYGLGAAVCARLALDREPDSVILKMMLGRLLLEEGRADEAEALIRSAIAQKAPDAQAVAMLGTSILALGGLHEATDAFGSAIALMPQQGYAYFALANTKRVSEEDRPMVAQMAHLAQSGGLAPKEMSFLQYGLGKACEDLGEYEPAMAAYDEANRIEESLTMLSRRFNPLAYAESFNRTSRLFPAAVFEPSRRAGSESELPIFVIGMMRSGTTLVEQVLSCHPLVAAAGELGFWTDNWQDGLNQGRDRIDPKGVRECADRYEALLGSIQPGKRHVTDKMPSNYACLGMMHLAFPNAKIIHTRRIPIDICLSIYATPNRSQVEFAHVKENIVFGYRQYERIMEHWRSVLPSDRFLEIDYEALVGDSEATIRRMLDFCGLEWNEACLHPDSNPRAVLTPSVWQVRQPFYRSSVARWKRFEPWLGAFRELLPTE